MSSATLNMLVSTLLFSLMGMGVKALTGVHFLQVVFFRALISFLICLRSMRSKNIPMFGENKPLLFLRGLFGTVSLMIYYYTLQTMPFATSVTLQHMAPLFAVFLAGIFFKERSNASKWIFLGVSFSGVLLIRGFDGGIHGPKLALALLGAFTSGLAYNVIRRISGSEEGVVIVFYFPLVTLSFVTPFLGRFWSHPTPVQWFWLVFVGLTTHFAQIHMTRAYRLEKVSNIVHLDYLSIVYAVILGYGVFGERLSFLTFVGIAMIALGSYLNSRFAKVT